MRVTVKIIGSFEAWQRSFLACKEIYLLNQRMVFLMSEESKNLYPFLDLHYFLADKWFVLANSCELPIILCLRKNYQRWCCSLLTFIWLRTKVAACAKHFVGDGGTLHGVDESNTVISSNSLFSIHMPAYYDSLRKGVATVMVSYSSWNGRKMHANRDLVTGFLKDKLKFRVSLINSLHCKTPPS